MTVSLKHSFQSPKSDTSDPTLVQPSNWNAEHALTCAANTVLGNSSASNGAVTEIPCTAVGRAIIGAATTTDVVNQLGINALLPSFPPGMIMPFGAANAPTGFLICNGAAVSRTTYAALFAVLGTTWGSGDGSTTFNLPDLRGVFLRGLDSGRGRDTTTNRAFASYQEDAYPEHSHTITDPGHAHTYIAGGASTGFVAGGTVPVSTSAPASGSTTTPVDRKTGITGTNNSGSGTETRPRNVAVIYCIKT